MYEVWKSELFRWKDYEGVTSRYQLWSYLLISWALVGSVWAVMLALMWGKGEEGALNIMPWFLMIIFPLHITYLVGLLALLARRLHDIGLSAKWWFTWFLPPVGQFIFVLALVKRSKTTDNKFGLKFQDSR